MFIVHPIPNQKRGAYEGLWDGWGLGGGGDGSAVLEKCF